MFTPAPTPGNVAWFVQDRFGMFIHWGLYSLAARHEWVKYNEAIPDEVYQRYFVQFNPDLYDPRSWARAAREAGMKYVVLTAKHHEGFCLWDSKLTDYKITRTPYGRDALQTYVEAFRAEGLKVGFYYSLIDWHHPDFPIDGQHPMRDDPDAINRNKTKSMQRYAEYLHGQVRELLTEFGRIDILWFDFSYPDFTHRGLPGKGRADWQSDKLLQMVRQLQPGIIVNNRLNLPKGNADFYTPEQYQPRSWVQIDGEPVVWEACQTFSGSWGYYRDEDTWKSPEQLIQMLVNTVACGGNLIMNVGPTARGSFDQRALNSLGVYAEWMRVHSRAIYGCTQSSFTPPQDCRFTQSGNRLYLHVFNWPYKHIGSCLETVLTGSYMMDIRARLRAWNSRSSTCWMRTLVKHG
ncbi:MAG: alpha-L-fucosidase [Chloroflexi bacterium]|nr:alpha-L-fucosidase [Chloroflexota bacterium]MCL5275170.1 alpha-L-fucosidase [Chloroflexota bacterium]